MRLRDSNWDEMPSESEDVVKKSARTPSTFKFVRSVMDQLWITILVAPRGGARRILRATLASFHLHLRLRLRV